MRAQVDRLEAGLMQSQLAIERARVGADTAETKWTRYQKLRESGVIDANTYDEGALAARPVEGGIAKRDTAVATDRSLAEGSARAAGQGPSCARRYPVA